MRPRPGGRKSAAGTLASRRRTLLGYPLDAVSMDEAVAWVLQAATGAPAAADVAGTATPRPGQPALDTQRHTGVDIQAASPRAAPRHTPGDTPKLVVTLNPEIIVQAERDAALAAALRQAALSVADGVGVTWAAARGGFPLPQRVPGVELSMRVLEHGGAGLRVFLLGGRPGVPAAAAVTVRERFGCQVVGTRHGYFARPDEVPEVCAAVRRSGAQLLLAGLGEGQERFLHENADALGVPVMIGVGGTLDVLAGTVRRMPAWTSRLGVEWLFRVGLDPKRWRRFPRLLRFVWLVLADKRRTRA